MQVLFLVRAQNELARIAQRWRPNARNPGVFDEDLSEVIARLRQHPMTGVVVVRSQTRTVYRMAASKTKLHVYYAVDEANAVVRVLHVWSIEGGPRSCDRVG